jgi:hypothetical protein
MLMKLAESNLYIDAQKINNYLLNINHPDGRSKAKLLVNSGFDINRGEQLENVIRNHASSNEVKEIITTRFGEKYVIEGFINTPKGSLLSIRSIWVKELSSQNIKFVTLYPI